MDALPRATEMASATELACIEAEVDALRKARAEALTQFLDDRAWRATPVHLVAVSEADTPHSCGRAPGGLLHLVAYNSTGDGVRRPGVHAVDECADGWLWLCTAQIARGIGCTVRSVHNALVMLRDLVLIAVHNAEPGVPVVYRLTLQMPSRAEALT